MHCPIDIELVDKFAEATEKYFAAVNGLINIIAGTKNGPFFQHSHQKARQKHKNCETAREAMEKHRVEHGCQANSPAK